MGGGRWDPSVHQVNTSSLRSLHGGSTFAHTHTMQSTKPRSSWHTHDSLDPKRKNQNGPFEGKITRESADSDEHPESRAVAVFLDVTASNGTACQATYDKLPELHGLLLRKGYIEHPQVLFAAIGDANCDRAPLQVGQFESDNRMDEHLSNMLLEFGGGGQMMETYELGAYMLARHSHIDCFEKRGEKGYAFFIGDEQPYAQVRTHLVESLIGDKLEADIPTKDIFAELRKKWEVYFLFQSQGSYTEQMIIPTWAKYLGDDHTIVLEEATAVPETIAAIIGTQEGAVSLDDALDDIDEVSSDKNASKTVGKALAKVGGSGSGSLATVSGGNLPDLGSDDQTERL